MIVPVILSGGSGTRLWPWSRSLYPKQFLPLTSEQTLLQETLCRLRKFTNSGIMVGDPVVICNEDHRFMVAEQLRAISLTAADIILEPFGRNTAPAIALAALSQPDAVLLVLPADHVITDIPAFEQAVAVAAQQAQEEKLVTFGIVPTAPETGYGYIKVGSCLNETARKVDRFVEKPDQATAENYFSSDHYLWNSGMFLFKASRYIQELEILQPDMLRVCRDAVAHADRDLDFTRINAEDFEPCPDDSIDYAVMEKTQDAVIVPLDAGWNDIGSWSALWQVSDQDENGNVVKKGHGDIIAEDTRGCYIQADKKLIATVGLEHMVIVDTDDAIMIADKGRVQDVKTIVRQLQQENRSEACLHRKVYRPWGYYDSIDAGERFQVKRIVVNPGAQLSLQMHHHRAEHWVVVQGTAEVRCGEKKRLLTENQSTYIPLGEIHSLANPGKFPLEIIEIQSGAYLEEDDIVRFEDKYGRE